jgi:hypothetical protein
MKTRTCFSGVGTWASLFSFTCRSNYGTAGGLCRVFSKPQGSRRGTLSYTAERQKALEALMDIGFNLPVPTRLAFDCIICRENIAEIEDIHRFGRLNNIFVLFVNYLPSGRTTDGHTSAISWEDQHKVFRRLAEIDEHEFGLKHATHFPYSGGVPCTIRGLGLFVTIRGDVFDCPGESVQLGNLKEESLVSVWQKAHAITEKFDGGCFPRQQFWKRLAALAKPAQEIRQETIVNDTTVSLSSGGAPFATSLAR